MKILSRLKINAVEEKFLPKEEVRPFYDAWARIRDIAEYDYNATEKIYKDIQNGKFKDSFKNLDKDMKLIENSVKKYPYGTSYSVKEMEELKSDYEKRKKEMNADNKAFNLVKIGDSQDSAINKIANGFKDSDIAKRFDKETKESLQYQIDRFKGTVVLKGGTDLYIQFINEKVAKKYF